MMKKCGLLGKKLGHSYSPAIHAKLGNYEYLLYEKTEEELEAFVKNGEWDGLNVTIPYKKTVAPWGDELSETACRMGAVNTLVRKADGRIFGDNTDVPGFAALVRDSGIEVTGKKVLVLGSGGASAAVCTALQGMDARITVISRRGEDNYENLGKHSDAAVIVNTTPVGMYPDNLNSPLDLGGFPSLEGVLDVVYNPARTGILLQAEERGIPYANGLFMLVAQAKRSSELFTGEAIPDETVAKITAELESSMQNIILIGMPGCGKTSVARALAKKLGRPVSDADAQIEKMSEMTIPEIFAQYGEEEFRRRETTALSQLGKASGSILSTGGGCVTREENYAHLHQNGTIFWICRDTGHLARKGRPLSAGNLDEMYRIRKPLYERFADYKIDNNGPLEKTAEQIVCRLRHRKEDILWEK